MKVCIDAGGICASTLYGTGRFTDEVLHALSLYGSYDYTAALFCNPSIRYKKIHYRIFPTSKAWFTVQLPIYLYLNRFDVYFALSQAIPRFAPKNIITQTHGLSFRYFPADYPKENNTLSTQFTEYMKRSKSILSLSKRLTEQLEKENTRNIPIKTVPFGIPFVFQDYEEQKRRPFFLYVGSDQSIKNVTQLIQTFIDFVKLDRYKHFTLKIVGEHNNTINHPNIEYLGYQDVVTLKNLYQTAYGMLTMSKYEASSFTVIEALSQQCPVLGLESALSTEQQEFSHVAQTKEDFFEHLMAIADGRIKKINKAKFFTIFSWKNYVNEVEGIIRNI